MNAVGLIKINAFHVIIIVMVVIYKKVLMNALLNAVIIIMKIKQNEK